MGESLRALRFGSTGIEVFTQDLLSLQMFYACIKRKENSKLADIKKITAKNMIVITLTTGSLECLVETVNHTSNLPITLYKE